MSNRREFCLSLSALAAVTQLAQTAFAQSAPAATMQAGDSTAASTLAAGTTILTDNHIFRAGSLPIKPSAVGTSQEVIHGVLPTGEGIEMHNSTLQAGHEPHPPHQHPHAEFLFLTAGNVQWLIDGKREAATAGDILYAAPGVLHGMRNTGSTEARYFVLAIGPNLAQNPA